MRGIQAIEFLQAKYGTTFRDHLAVSVKSGKKLETRLSLSETSMIGKRVRIG
jgi:hypothetical protein